MKKIAIIAILTSLSAIAGMRAINVSSGTKTLDERYIPYGCAELKGVECLMYNGNGSLSMSVDRTMGEVINHVDYNTYYGTNIVTNLLYRCNDYYVSVTACVVNADYSWPLKTSTRDIGFSKMTTYESTYIEDYNNSRFTMKQTPFETYRTGGYTNLFIEVKDFFAHRSYVASTNIAISASSFDDYLTFGDTNSFVVCLKIVKSQEYDVVRTNYNTYIDHIVTNRWSEGVSKTWTVNVLRGAQLTNGIYVKYFDSPLHVFKGDVIRCTSPITTNNPGRVRAIINDDSFGTQSPFLNEE